MILKSRLKDRFEHVQSCKHEGGIESFQRGEETYAC